MKIAAKKGGALPSGPPLRLVSTPYFDADVSPFGVAVSG